MPAKPINWVRFAGTQTQPALVFTYFKERLVQTHKHNTCWYANWPGPVAIIATAQLFGTSLWFSANGAAEGLMRAWHLASTDIGWLTSAVQAGFITGTLAIALGGIADRFRASRLFMLASIAGCLSNAAFALLADGLVSGIIFRFMVGVSLAGIYPLGMKLIVSWAPERTGLALAQLVAMLTLGTALPHALREAGAGIPWQYVILASSALALLGALLIWILGDGPHLPSTRPRVVGAGVKPVPPSVLAAFRVPKFRAAAFGYFGHMWELYAFWTIVPVLLINTTLAGHFAQLGVSGWAFAVIGMGAVGSLAGGVLSRHIGSAKVALGALAGSLCCGLIFAMFWRTLPAGMLLVTILLWGATVVADSPQFSALSAKACPPDQVGAALAIQNSIGFAITVISISATTSLFDIIGVDAVWLLVPGPVLGLAGFAWASRPKPT